MNIVANFEHRASSSRGKHEGESSFALCDRLGRTRDNSQRQLPTDHDYAVPTREYQTDQSSLKPAPAAARSVLEKTQRQLQKHPHRLRSVDTVTPYQGNALIQSVSAGRPASTRLELKNARRRRTARDPSESNCLLQIKTRFSDCNGRVLVVHSNRILRRQLSRFEYYR